MIKMWLNKTTKPLFVDRLSLFHGIDTWVTRLCCGAGGDGHEYTTYPNNRLPGLFISLKTTFLRLNRFFA